MVESFATATGKRPDFICGKPEQSFLDLIVKRYHYSTLSCYERKPFCFALEIHP